MHIVLINPSTFQAIQTLIYKGLDLASEGYTQEAWEIAAGVSRLLDGVFWQTPDSVSSECWEELNSQLEDLYNAIKF